MIDFKQCLSAFRSKRTLVSGTSTPASKSKGFTLIEVMVSIAIFAVISGITFTALNNYINHREILTKSYGQLEQLQRLFIMLERDIRFVIDRPFRIGSDEYNAIEFDLDGDLMHLNVALPDTQSPTGVRLQHVAWTLDEPELRRKTWDVLDVASGDEPEERVIDSNIDGLEFSLLYFDGSISRETEFKDRMPDGIEVIALMANGQSYRRVFEIASHLP